MVYERRPPVCSDFPYGRACDNAGHGCKAEEEQPMSKHVMGDVQMEQAIKGPPNAWGPASDKEEIAALQDRVASLSKEFGPAQKKQDEEAFRDRLVSGGRLAWRGDGHDVAIIHGEEALFRVVVTRIGECHPESADKA